MARTPTPKQLVEYLQANEDDVADSFECSIADLEKPMAILFAAPDLLEALKEADKVLELAKRYFPWPIKNGDRFTLLNVQANSVRAAIAKATT